MGLDSLPADPHLSALLEALRRDGTLPDLPIPPAPPSPERYRDEGLLGIGGMGEVRRVFDSVLQRSVARKCLRADRKGWEERFNEEARATARLLHAGILPVFDFGTLPDGRPYFTMPEVQGQPLTGLIQAVHAASVPAAFRPTADGWTFRRLIDTFLKVCEAVGYAHQQGFLHRDLKPANVMVGSLGDVLVVDWGLARAPRDDPDQAPHQTRYGTVMGTPAYMAPEQAAGEVDRIDARTDVYALGAMLYEICAGRSPYQGETGQAVIAAVLQGAPAPLQDHRVPAELIALCQTAMARAPEDRPPHAGALTAELLAFLDGERKRDKALALVQAAEARAQDAQRLAIQGEQAHADAQQQLVARPGWQPVETRLDAWAAEDEALAMQQEAERLDQEAEALLEAALTHDPGLPAAHAAILGRLQAEHRQSPPRRASQLEAKMRRHLQHLPPTSDEARQFARYLQGDGALSLVSDPPGADVQCFRYEPQQRRQVAVFFRSLGVTPLRAAPLPTGSYLLELSRPDRPTVRYPVQIGRLEHWEGTVVLPEQIPPSCCYVPAGPAQLGGPPGAATSLPPQRRWVERFFIQRHPVTNADYIRFLDALVAQGRAEEADRHQPRYSSSAGKLGLPIYGQNQDGSFFLKPDPDGDLWEPDWPVVMVTWEDAHAYARYLASLTGLPWRLPREFEWEKAARGVDGRAYPWGDYLDPSFCWMRDSHRDRPSLTHIHAAPLDESPYGVRGMAGNVTDWTADPFTEHLPAGTSVPPLPDGTPALCVFKGGGWSFRGNVCVAYARWRLPPNGRRIDVGFRLCWSPRS